MVVSAAISVSASSLLTHPPFIAISFFSFPCILLSIFVSLSLFLSPIMPGVMQVEALAQLAGIVCLQMEGATPGSVFFFAAVDGVKWKRPVVPGDTMVMEVEIIKWTSKFGIAKASGKAYVDGKICIDVKEMTFALAK